MSKEGVGGVRMCLIDNSLLKDTCEGLLVQW
jgi:hypothetical protein